MGQDAKRNMMWAGKLLERTRDGWKYLTREKLEH